jgi:tetratricopeptide (TPR) repeat protein
MSEKIDKALDLFRNYKLEDAEDILKTELELNSNNIDALIIMGKISSRKQDYGSSINFFNKVLDLQPDNNEAKVGLKLIKNILQLSNNYYYENPYTDDELYEFD